MEEKWRKGKTLGENIKNLSGNILKTKESLLKEFLRMIMNIKLDSLIKISKK